MLEFFFYYDYLFHFLMSVISPEHLSCIKSNITMNNRQKQRITVLLICSIYISNPISLVEKQTVSCCYVVFPKIAFLIVQLR